eukprot:GFKZ01011753.1.p1 GENE.GFKZ01011753.1~~GFKZ01011753.1.p1  ORF type:complete len:140 (-),score=11.10 GFKZ01011753.1:745-1164(-)
MSFSAAFATPPPLTRSAFPRISRTPRHARFSMTSPTPRRAPKPTPPEEPPSSPDPSYWRGEWICVDCGYLYKPGRRVKFEDLPNSWKCPQCNAPKRRFAKKAGDLIAETAGTSNAPIIVFSLVGLLATVLFGIWASSNL